MTSMTNYKKSRWFRIEWFWWCIYKVFLFMYL